MHAVVVVVVVVQFKCVCEFKSVDQFSHSLSPSAMVPLFIWAQHLLIIIIAVVVVRRRRRRLVAATHAPKLL